MMSKHTAAIAVTTLVFFFTPATSQASCLHTNHGMQAMQGHTMASMPQQNMDRWSLCADFMSMNADGAQQGKDHISSSDVLSQGYSMAPLSMDMMRYQLGVGYQIADPYQIYIAGQFRENDMVMRSMMMPRIKAHTSGWGDTEIGVNTRLFHDNRHQLTWGMGVSLPTGSIDEMANNGVNHAAYKMQLGSGTYDLLPSLSYMGMLDRFQYGAKIGGTIHLGENDNDYTLGDEVYTKLHAGYALTPWLRAGAMIQATHSWKIEGADPAMMASMMPGSNADNSGGDVIKTGVMLTLTPPVKGFENHSLSIHYARPVYQDYNGIQMDQTQDLMIGWTARF